MRQKSRPQKPAAEQVIKDIWCATRAAADHLVEGKKAQVAARKKPPK